MQNKFFGSKLNTVLLLILIILMIVALRWMHEDREKYWSNFSPDAEKWAKAENKAYEDYNNKQASTWINSPSEFGNVVSYPSNWQITPQYYGTPAMMAGGGKESLVGYNFILPSGASVMWGGPQSHCINNNEFGEFKYGASTFTCVNGLRADLGRASAREVLSLDDLNLFGDFVLMNK